MSKPVTAFVAVFLLAACVAQISGSAHADKSKAPVIAIAGDSLCVGLAQASGIQSVARVGAPTREVISQLGRLPEGATVIVCAGTNDAAARLYGFQASVDAVLAKAAERNQRIIWVGPVSTTLWWEPFSDQADTYLALKIKSYVSLRAIGWNPGERAGDRIHLTPKGYARVWAIVKGKL